MKQPTLHPMDPAKLVQVTLNRDELVLINQMCALGLSVLRRDVLTTLELSMILDDWTEWHASLSPLMRKLVDLGTTAWPELVVD